MAMAERSERLETGDPGAVSTGTDTARSPRGWLGRHLAPLLIALIGLAVTGAVTAVSHANYVHAEQRTATLQARLTQSALAVGPVDLERRLGKAATEASLTAGTPVLFDKAIATSVAKGGPLVAAELFELAGGQLRLLASAGSAPVIAPTSPPSLQFAEVAARTPTLVVERVVRPGLQRLAYGFAASVSGGGPTFVSYGEQAFPPSRRVRFPATNPDSSLNLAVFFGRSVAPSALIESTRALPIPGPTASALVPFGNQVLTVEISPRSSLMGDLATWAPWIVLALGLVFTGCAVVTAEWLARRRRTAEERVAVTTSMYRRQREASETLQQALLPPELPTVRGVDVAARYRSGSVGVDVGGDWYDVVVADDTLFFSVGDVSGRGAQAAVVMAQLRLALNAFGFHGADPATALDKVAPMLDFSRHGRFATVLCGQVEPGSGRILVANAGHIPPVVITDHGASVVELPADPPLGVGTAYRNHRLVLGDGDTLLAVTDGIVERHDEPIDAGLSRLCSHARTHLPLDRLLDELLEALVPEGPHDDIAMLAIKRTGAAP